jgi:transcriptional regulator with XRE-family HTH domain
MDTVQNLLAHNVRALREVSGWSREQFSERVQISTNYLSEIEAGKKFPRPAVIDTICKVMGVHPSELFAPETALKARLGADVLAQRLREQFPDFLATVLQQAKQTPPS